MEIWKEVREWENWYEVSSHGRVRSVERQSTAGGFPATYKSRVLRTGGAKAKYPTATLTKPGLRKCVNVHQLVAEAFIGPAPFSLEVCHNDGVRSNNFSSNLRYDTRRANAADRKLHGTNHSRPLPGEANGHAKLTDEAVVLIRSNPHLTLKQLAAITGVHFTTVHMVRRRKTWGHLA